MQSDDLGLVARLGNAVVLGISTNRYGVRPDNIYRICEEAANALTAKDAAIERLEAERDEARAKVSRQARLLGEQADRIRRLRAEVRRHIGRDPYDPKPPFSLHRMMKQNETNYRKFAVAEAQRDKLKEAASTYFERYCQDEAVDVENCVCGEQQHRDAIALRDALALGDTL